MTGQSTSGGFYSVIPARYLLVLMGFLAFNLVYAYKVVLSVTIVAMVGHKNMSEADVGTECEDDHPRNSTQPTSGEFHWTSGQQALILGGYFYGYVVTQIPGGFMSERYGAKWVFGGSMLVTAIFSLVAPFAAKWHYLAFFGVRLIQGLAQGAVFPAMNAIFGRWLPKMERSFMATITYTGSMIGTVITLPLAGVLSDGQFLGGWPAIWYILGAVGCVWFVLWSCLYHESPDQHPHITEAERRLIKDGQDSDQKPVKRPLPVGAMLRSVPMWALVFTHFGQNWGFLTILTMLPTYFEKILHMDIKKNGLMSSFPYLLQALIGWTTGYLTDRVRRSGRVRINIIRKVANSVAFFGSAACLVAVALSGCNVIMTIAFFTLALGFNGAHFSGFPVTGIDMAPDFAGTIMGVTNSLSNINGFIQPVIVSAITSGHQTKARWATIFYMSAGAFTLSNLIYILFASAELQPWGARPASGAREEKRTSDGGQRRDNLAIYSVSDPKTGKIGYQKDVEED